MKFTRMHAFLIVCFAAIASVLIFFIIPIWACSLASFIGIIALTYMLNDYFEEKWGRKDTQEAEVIDLEPAPAPDDSYGRWDAGESSGRAVEHYLHQREPIERRKAIPLYMDLFDIDEVRATNLYRAGYYNFVMLADAKTKELVFVKGINPTLARKIKMKANEI